MVSSSLIIPDVAGTFLSGWNFLASSMYLLLTCLSDTISLRLNPKMPSDSLRFTSTPSGSYPLLFRGGRGRKVVVFTLTLALTSSGGWSISLWAGGVRG